MTPFLKKGVTLHYAMEKCGLLQHKDLIYKKYREDKDFIEKIDTLRSRIGELTNLIAYDVLENVHLNLTNTNGKYELSKYEENIWKTVAEKHRTAQPFFVTRTEEAKAKKEEFGKVVDPPTINYIVPNESTETTDQLQSDTETAPSVEKAE